jgi:hypothetical protein
MDGVMSDRLYTLVMCDDCGDGYPVGEMIPWPCPSLLLCVACAMKLTYRMGQHRTTPLSEPGDLDASEGEI